MSTQQKLERFLDGVVARGWAYDGVRGIDFSEAPTHGYVRRVDDGSVVYEAIDANPLGDGKLAFERTAPKAYALSTPLGGAILLELWPKMGGTFTVGGGAESVFKVQGNAVLFGIDLSEVRGLLLSKVNMNFPGLGEWAGLRIIEQEFTTTGNSLDEHTIRLQNPPMLSTTRLTAGSLSLNASANWRVSEPIEGALDLRSGLTLTLEASRPRPLDQFASTFASIQDLLSMANRRLVLAIPAVGELAGGGPEPRIYHRHLMHAPARAILRSSGGSRQRIAYLGSQLGGVTGMARWTSVAKEHQSAIDAVCSSYREGPESPTGAIRSLGAEFELYVASFARSREWAQKKGKPKGFTFTLALALHAGPAFKAWVGDSYTWAEEFHASYLSSKHLIKGSAPDPQKELILAQTGRWLLTAILADRAAGNRAPSRHTFTGSEMSAMGARARRVLGTAKERI